MSGVDVGVLSLLIDLWLDSIFGPLYHLTFRIKFSLACKDRRVEDLIISNPSEFLNTLSNVFNSESVAESFICTLTTYAKKYLNMVDVPTCDEFIEWFKSTNSEAIVKFMVELARRRGLIH